MERGAREPPTPTTSGDCQLRGGAEGRTQTDTGLTPPFFETGASTIPPLRHELTT